MADTKSATEPTDEQVVAAAMAFSDATGTLGERTRAALRAALSVSPSASTEDDREALRRGLHKSLAPVWGTLARSVTTNQAEYDRFLDALADAAEAEFARRSPDAVLAALRVSAPETVTTVEELDALPPQTVIYGAGLVYEKYANSGGMWSGTRRHILVEAVHLAMILPARVLFRPTREEG